MTVKLGSDLAREIRKSAPPRTDRQAYFAFAHRVEAAAEEMSSTAIRDHFNDYTKKHGRVVTAICVAATIYARRNRLDGWCLPWAQAVLDAWPHTEGLLDRAAIRDSLHPTRICEYAQNFIRLNSEA